MTTSAIEALLARKDAINLTRVVSGSRDAVGEVMRGASASAQSLGLLRKFYDATKDGDTFSIASFANKTVRVSGMTVDNSKTLKWRGLKVADVAGRSVYVSDHEGNNIE